MREVLVRGYIEPAGSQEEAARELNMSRTAYFRRLRAGGRAGRRAPRGPGPGLNLGQASRGTESGLSRY